MPPHLSPYAGQWYPAGRQQLEALLESRFAASRERTGPYVLPDPLAFVVPHAAPQWSGTVASAVYRAIRQAAPRHIIVLAFPHRGGLARVATPQVDHIATPLGALAVDRSFEAHFPAAPEWRLCDHSLEIQLPFLQWAAPGARVTPLYVGHLDPVQRLAAARTLADACSPGVLYLASSDFNHYGRDFGFQPFAGDPRIEERLRDLDFDCIDAAATLHAGHFLSTIDATGATVCGAGPIALLLDVLTHRASDAYQTTLDYQTSAAANGDFSHSVSYAALGYYRAASFRLDRRDGQLLLELAEQTLRALRGEAAQAPAAAHAPVFRARRGSFVSLYSGDGLLGCVGNVEGKNSLAEDVVELTRSAALEDDRFRPAARTPGPIQVEISLLTPLRPILQPSEFSVQRHGAVLQLDNRRGVLLPHVAARRGWNAEQFWRALSRKSGLWPEAWRDPRARLWIFEAQVLRRD